MIEIIQKRNGNAIVLLKYEIECLQCKNVDILNEREIYRSFKTKVGIKWLLMLRVNLNIKTMVIMKD